MSNLDALNRRTALALMAAGLATAAERSFAAGPVEQKMLEIGANRDPQLGAHVAIAATKGYFAEEGVDVKVHWTQVSGDLQPLLAGGAINVAAFGMHSTINLRARKVPLRTVCALCEYSGTQGLVLAPGKKLASPAELMGKRIAAPNQAPHEMALAKLGKQYGFDPKKIIVVRMEPSESISAMARGDVDGALTFQPHLYKLLQMGGTLYFTGRISYIDGQKKELPLDDRLLYIHSTLNVNEKWLAQNPNTTEALIRAMIKAQDLIVNQQLEAQKILQDFLHAEAEALRQSMEQNVYGLAIDEALHKSVLFSNDWLTVNGQLPAPVPPADTIATKPLEDIDPKLVTWKG
jgi:ABC-type nitrate/sulfonate/bicarbonate transport system substrate-binding protein